MAEASDVSRLVWASASGDQAAWNELVRRYSPLVMAITRTYQLDTVDAQDVSQTVWLRLVEHLAYLRNPEALPGWLAQTTRRECWHQIQRRHRVMPVDPHTDDAMLLSGDQRAAGDEDREHRPESSAQPGQAAGIQRNARIPGRDSKRR